MGLDGRTSGGWVQNNSMGAALRTAPSLKKDKIILSGRYLEERIELTEYVLFNMCSPLYLHLDTTAELVHVWMTFSRVQRLRRT